MMQSAKESGERLKGEVFRSAVDLIETTDRAKEYERSMTSFIDNIYFTNQM